MASILTQINFWLQLLHQVMKKTTKIWLIMTKPTFILQTTPLVQNFFCVKHSNIMFHIFRNMKKTTITTIFLFLFILGWSQNITDNKFIGLKYKVYRLDSTQARVLYQQNQVTDTVDLFTNLETVLYTDSSFDLNTLPKGHYLIAKARGTFINYETFESRYFDIRSTGYNGEAWIFITDYKGNTLEDAKLEIKDQSFSYRDDCNCYPVPGVKGNGWAKITHGDQFTYINIDGYKAPKDKYKNTKTKYQNKKVFTSVRILPGYVAYNQPKYQLADTVKLKAFLVKENGKPWKRKVRFKILDNFNKVVYNQVLPPVTEGAFVHDFPIPDTFEIDKTYQVQFTSKRNMILKRSEFRIEDYELGNTTYKAKMSSNQYYNGQTPVIIMEGKDANDLPLLDAHATINIRYSHMTDHYRDTIFEDYGWKNSIFRKEMLLDVSGETRLEIPDSIFPLAKAFYQVDVTLNNSENEPKSFRLNFGYDANTERYNLELDGDTINAEYYYLNKLYTGCTGTLLTYYNEVLLEEKEISFPYYEKLNYASTEYVLKDQLGNIVKRIQTPNRINELIYVEGKRTHDSVYIDLKNDLGIPISWQIYKSKKKIDGGRGSSLNYAVADESLDSYYIIYSFRWQDKDMVLENGFHIKEKNLTVDVDQPETVFPGAKVPITVSVTDYKNDAMKDVNLTAWSVNVKFGDIPSPNLPYFGLNHFEILRPFSVTHQNQKVVHSAAIKQKHIDLLDLYDTPYYRFIYSKGGVDTEYDSINSEWAEFTPYVYTSGNLSKVFTVYLDDEPVYMDNRNNYHPLSIKKKPGKYELKVRTKTHLYTIKEIELKAQQKAFICLNTDSSLTNQNVEYVKLDSIPYMQAEEEFLKSNMLLVNLPRYGEIYLEQDSIVIRTSNNKGEKYYDKEFRHFNYYGPFKKGKINITDVQRDTAYSFYFEPGYLYTFTGDTSYVSQPVVYPNPLRAYYPYDYNTNWNFSVRSFTPPKVNLPEPDPKVVTKQLIRSEKNRKPKKHPLLKNHYQKGDYRRKNCIVNLKNHTGKQILWTAFFNEENDSLTYVKFGHTGQVNYIKPGTYNIYQLLNDSSYILLPNYHFYGNGINHIKFDMSYAKPHNQEVLSQFEEEVIRLNKPPVREFNNPPREIKGITVTSKKSENKETMMSGYLMNHHGEPIDFATIYAEIQGYFKGGATTNQEGYFEIRNIPPGNYMLKIMLEYEGNYSIYNIKVPKGRNTQIMIEPEFIYHLNEVMLRDEVSVMAEESYYMDNASASYSSPMISVNELSSVQVSGASSNIRVFKTSIKEISAIPATGGEADIAQYLQTIPGVTNGTGKGKLDILGKEAIESLKQDPNSNRIRNTFRDYGFWRPNLVTDKDGKARFTVQYPDNITQWKTIVPAMDGKKNSGIGYSYTKSYKPLSANLGLPNFLVQGDTANVVGKVLNYTEDPIGVKTYFNVNDTRMYTGDQSPKDFSVETYPLSYDSIGEITVTYGLDKGDGYIDGEARKLKVLVEGVERSKGTLLEIEGDTNMTLTPNEELTGRTIFITNDPFDLIKRELEELKNYQYGCNEQTASKLKALLLEKQFLTQLNEPFKGEKQLVKCLKKLEKNQNKDGSWGWWDKSSGDTWITGYVTEALNLAVAGGYRTKAHMKGGAYLKSQLNQLKVSDRLDALNSMASIPYPMDYQAEIKKLENLNLSLQDRFQYYKLLQSQDSTININDIIDQHEKAKKGIYWGEELFNVKVNKLKTSLVAYEILKKAGGHEELLKQTRRYFLNYKANARNTIEQANMLQQFLGDMLKESTLQEAVKPEITINGSNAGSEYPMEFKFDGDETVKITKKGAPINLYQFDHSVEKAPECSDSLFTIKTSFVEEGKTVTSLTEGKPITMVVDVVVKKPSKYVLLEIPIPAACSYGGKVPRKNSHEEYRKQFLHMTAIACRHLSAGKHQFTIQLVPRFSGVYSVLPASIQLMYFPDVSHYSPTKKIQVLPKQ